MRLADYVKEHFRLHFYHGTVLWRFLGAFAKLRTATISFVISVCLYVWPYGITLLPLDEFW